MISVQHFFYFDVSQWVWFWTYEGVEENLRTFVWKEKLDPGLASRSNNSMSSSVSNFILIQTLDVIHFK